MRANTGIPFACFVSFSLCLVLALNAQDQKSTNPSETVIVRVSVFDPMYRFVTGLAKKNFTIYEDKVEQTISSFSGQAVPMSLGIVWDVSRSMRTKEIFEKAKAAVLRLLDSRKSGGECFLITFSESARIQQITEEMLQAEVRIDTRKGLTALFDAVYMGLERINDGRHEKKVLVIISDGEDNRSRHKASEISRIAKESDVQIYAIMEPGPMTDKKNAILNIASITGGTVWFTQQGEPDYYARLLLSELQSQYRLCYTPANNKHDGTWRKITVRLNPPPGLPKLAVRARQGRYAPKN